MSPFSVIDLTVDGRIAVIKLNRPEKLNAINRRIAIELEDALDQLGEVWALIVTGSDKAFSAGADLAEMGAAPGEREVDLQALYDRIAALPFPTIAAVEGYCLGGGLELALCFDLRIASETARFGTPEVTRGIIPGGGGTTRLPRLIGIPRAKEMMYLGEHYSAGTVAAWGLVNKVVPPGLALDEALRWAGRLIERAPLALREVKDIVNNGMEMPLDEARRYEQRHAANLFGSEDVREGIQAFIERRKPNFKGK